MATNPRIYYPINAIGFAPIGTPLNVPSGYRAAKGVQSAGITTTFSLEQVYQLGQLELYENIENLPEVEITVEKVIDGYSMIQHLATPRAIASSLAGRFNDNQCMVVLAHYPITNEAASGNPLSYMQLSGVFVSAINFSIPVEGNSTESITLTCRDKVWGYAPSGSPWLAATAGTSAPSGRSSSGPFTGSESPILASGGVSRRENVLMGSGAGLSRWPTDIPGIDLSGYNASGVGGYAAHIQSVNVSTSLGRTDLLELGRRGPYFRYATFPTEVTCSIETTATELGDYVDARQDETNLSDEVIFIAFSQGLTIDLGTKNKLQSVSYDGGSTGGENRTATYNYSNFNSLKVLMASTDPAGLTS